MITIRNTTRSQKRRGAPIADETRPNGGSLRIQTSFLWRDRVVASVFQPSDFATDRHRPGSPVRSWLGFL